MDRRGGIANALSAAWWRTPRHPLAWSPADAALAAAAALLVQAEVWGSDVAGPPLALTTGGLLATVPLAWRRSAPITSAVLVCLGFLLMTGAATSELAPQTPILPVTVAVYSAGAWTEGRSRAVAAGVLTFGLVLAGYLAAPEGHVDDFFPYAVWAGAFGTGRLVHRHSGEAARSATRAALLEEERRFAEQEAAIRERARIARDLHDVVGHSVSLMVVQAGAERLRLGGTGPTAEALLRIEEAGREALGDLRTMLEVMDVPDAGARGLAPVPDVAALSGLVDRLRAAGLPTTLTVEGDWVAVPGGVQLAVYRVVQEALTNVLRHASGATASVVARAQDGAVDVTVTDDGSGARRPGTSPGAGRGLVGMRERVAAHGGTLTAGPAPDGGFRVEARMPVAS